MVDLKQNSLEKILARRLQFFVIKNMKQIEINIKMKKTIYLLALYFIANSVLAGTGTGKITGIIPYTKSATEKLFFIAVESKTNSPDCNTTNRFVLSSKDQSYSEMVSAMMAAYHAKTPVKVTGKDNCDDWGNSEGIRYVCFGNIPC